MLEAGIAPELARMVLPQSMIVNWVWTGNLLAFAHVYRLRSGDGAQEEAKVFANQLGKVLYQLFPVSSKALLGEMNEPS
jgi:thymidylate synthase (FAD)